MKALKFIAAGIGLSLLLALNALAWVSVGEKYNTVKIQEAALLNLGHQLQEARMRNTMLEILIQRSIGQPPTTGPDGCPIFKLPRPAPPNDA